MAHRPPLARSAALPALSGLHPALHPLLMGQVAKEQRTPQWRVQLRNKFEPGRCEAESAEEQETPFPSSAAGGPPRLLHHRHLAYRNLPRVPLLKLAANPWTSMPLLQDPQAMLRCTVRASSARMSSPLSGPGPSNKSQAFWVTPAFDVALEMEARKPLLSQALLKQTPPRRQIARLRPLLQVARRRGEYRSCSTISWGWHQHTAEVALEGAISNLATRTRYPEG